MGLKITTSVTTSQGSTSALYLIIDRLIVNKTNMVAVVNAKRYLNKAARDADINDTVECFDNGVPRTYEYSLTQAEVDLANHRSKVYDKISAELTEQGFTNTRED
jgi:hypothetical protein